MTRRILIGIALGLGAAALAGLAALSSFGDKLEFATYDWRLVSTAHPELARKDIALIKIDQTTFRKLEPIFGRWPWPRIAHSDVIDFLTRAHARVIAYDVLFGEADRRSGFSAGSQTLTGEESDRALTDSVKRAGNVILLADAVYDDAANGTDSKATGAFAPPGIVYAPGLGLQVRPTIVAPYDSLLHAALGVGHNFAVLDDDETVRRFVPFVHVRDANIDVPSLGLAAALAAERVPAGDVKLDGSILRIGARQMPLLDTPVPAVPPNPPQSSRQVLLNYRGPSVLADLPTDTYPSYSFFDVLLSEERAAGGEKPPIDPEVFRDKIVFVGFSDTAMGDIFATPFHRVLTPGIQIHAALADDVLSSRFMRRASRSADITLTIIAGVAVGIVSTLLAVPMAVASTVAFAIVLVLGTRYEIGNGTWIAMGAPLMSTGIALFAGVAWRYFVEDREKRRVKKLFGRYVSKDVFDQLMSDPALATLGGQRREMTVLFSDIRGFTTASEGQSPEAVVLQLNEYFTAMVDVLFAHRGTLDKFVGDMVMGLFGAPVPDPQHADHAVAAALAMTATLDAMNARWTAEGRAPLNIGIGINTGEMIAGNIGSETIMSYTVIGDAVNLGARLESLNKDYGTRIIISDATRRQLTGKVDTRALGDVVVKGKTVAVGIFEVVDAGHDKSVN